MQRPVINGTVAVTPTILYNFNYIIVGYTVYAATLLGVLGRAHISLVAAETTSTHSDGGCSSNDSCGAAHANDANSILVHASRWPADLIEIYCASQYELTIKLMSRDKKVDKLIGWECEDRFDRRHVARNND